MYKIRPVLSLFCNKCKSRSRGILFGFCVSIFLLYLTEFQIVLNFFNIYFHFFISANIHLNIDVKSYTCLDV